MGTFNYKYNVDTKVFYIDQVSIPSYHACPTCNGDGVLLRKDGTDVQCPTCKGLKLLVKI